ncbi:MAG: hypothetical protein LBR36_09365 [Bacteroidales bacterium]|jgi:hypothetical protein|nr:hypothetical protein [Bacteroidales bacterium]
MAGFASCKKDSECTYCKKDCKCTYTDTSSGLTGSYTYTFTADELDKLGTTCKGIEDVLISYGGYETIYCKEYESNIYLVLQ